MKTEQKRERKAIKQNTKDEQLLNKEKEQTTTKKKK